MAIEIVKTFVVKAPPAEGSCPAASSEPSGAQRRLSSRNPTGMSSRVTGVWPRDIRITLLAAHRFT